MRIQSGVLILLVALGMGACTHRNNEKVGEAARKAELASEKAARELGKVARKAGQQIKSASRDAHEGYEEEKRKEKAKGEER